MSALNDPIYVPVWLAIVAGIPQVLAVISHFILQFKMNNLQKEVVTTKQEINGRMTQLLDTSVLAAHAKGVLEQKGREK